MTTSSPAGAPRAGDLVAARFRLGRLLGSGGMADVWEATDERLHRIVAIKILRRGSATAGEGPDAALARFRDEGRLAARRAHPNIVAVFDAGVSGDDTYLVMEHISGPTLRDRIDRGPLDDGEARLLMADVLAALEAAHRAGVVHRDIKPSNVLQDGDGRWKVADFGIAKAVESDGRADVTRTGQVIGTPQYMAPERLAGHRADGASDIYSAGILLREALGSRFGSSSALRLVVERATAVDPAARYSSARAMADAVARAGSVTPDRAAPLRNGGLLDDTVVSHDASGAAATIATPGLPTQVLDGRPHRSQRPRRIAIVAVLGILAAGGIAAAVRDDGPAQQQPSATSTTTGSAPASTTTTAAPTTTTAVATTTEVVVATTPQEPAPVTAPGDPKDKGKGKGEPKPGKGKDEDQAPAGPEP